MNLVISQYNSLLLSNTIQIRGRGKKYYGYKFKLNVKFHILLFSHQSYVGMDYHAERQNELF